MFISWLLVFFKQEKILDVLRIWVRCLSGCSMGCRSEPILLSKFGLIMHLSSLLCYSSAFILYSSCPVCGKWACGHTLLSALGVPHCRSSFVFCRAPFSPSLFLHQSLFMFSNCAGEEGDGRCGWRGFVSAGAMTVGVAREKWHFISWELVYAFQSHHFTPHCSSLAHLFFFFSECLHNDDRLYDVAISICTEMHSEACGLVSVTHKGCNIFMTENPFGKSSLSPFM